MFLNAHIEFLEKKFARSYEHFLLTLKSDADKGLYKTKKKVYLNVASNSNSQPSTAKLFKSVYPIFCAHM